MKKKMPPEALEFFKGHGVRGGKIGGKRRLVTMTPEQRSAIAKKAATARWANKKALKPQTEEPTIQRDPEALAALRVLQEKGFTPDQVEEALEDLRRNK